MAEIELDISLEEYYEWNEIARKEGLLLDEWMVKVLTKYFKELDKK
jgi:hypothetical protein